ncbi:MAG TPA: helix-turn-helix domain-containing protein [Methanocorpusculum sp.]|nr:helix-turn-helix domain-containing protein [Methanocorpusculum sp.]
MFYQRIFETDISVAISEELKRRGMSVHQLAAACEISPVTLYKIVNGERSPSFATVKKIAGVFYPRMAGGFIAVIAAKFLLEDIEGTKITINGSDYRIQGYPANSLEDCLAAAARARDEGASGIVCAPVLASLIEKIVDIPVAIMKPEMSAVENAVHVIAKRL